MSNSKQISNLIRTSGLFALLLLAVCYNPVQANSPEQSGQWIANYDEHTPGYAPKARALRAYERGDFSRAYSDFKLASAWADKFSQFNVGMLYLNGEGADYDPTRAWAWIELSAERGYPQFVDAADTLWSMLSEWEQQIARDYFEDVLLPKYGDHVAVRKTASKMRHERRMATGSRLGAVYGLNLDVIGSDGLPTPGDQFYATDKWDFEHIVAYETQLAQSLMRGRVEIRDVNTLDEDSN